MPRGSAAGIESKPVSAAADSFPRKTAGGRPPHAPSPLGRRSDGRLVLLPVFVIFFFPIKIPDKMRNKENELERKRHQRCLPKLTRRNPEEDVGNDKSDEPPFKRDFQGSEEPFAHFRIIRALDELPNY
jgi:hypothetical protein